MQGTEHAFCLRVDSQDGNNSAPVKPALCDCRLVFEAMLDADDYWNTNFFTPHAMRVHGIPFHERRHFDSVKATIASTALVFQGLSPNYGTGWDYWSYGPGAVRNYKDWIGQRALPLQSLALDGALAEWGMVGQARAGRVEFYFANFFHPDGSFKMDDWGCNRDKNAWTRANNVMNDALADFGRMIGLWVKVLALEPAVPAPNATHANTAEGFVQRTVATAATVVRYVLEMRKAASIGTHASSFPGMVIGSPEHDKCGHPDYYFSTQVLVNALLRTRYFPFDVA
jgi:hypothetical protein